MEKTDSKFYALHTSEDGNLEFDVKIKLEKKFKDIRILVPLKKTRVKIDSSFFNYYERIMPGYLLFSHPLLSESILKRIAAVKGIENVLIEKTSNDGEIALPIEHSEFTKIMKSTPTDKELADFYEGNSTNVIFGQYAGYACSVISIDNLVARITIPSTQPVLTTLPVWYLGKEEA